MFQKIFVPLDGSSLAESVLPAVEYLASKFSSEVRLFHVIEKNPPRKIHGQLHLTNAEEAESYLKAVSDKIEEEGLNSDFHVHKEGMTGVADSIIDHLAELDYDLIIMCSHGRSGIRQLFFGSIAQQVLNKSRIPLLMIPPRELPDSSSFSCRRIQVPLDNNPDHFQGLYLLSRMVEKCESEVFIVRVIPTLTSIPGRWRSSGKLLPSTSNEMLNMQSEEAEAQLKEQADEFFPAEVRKKIGVFRGDPVEIIPKSAIKFKTDMLVLNTHGNYGLDAIWSGSFAAQVCRNCSIPILFLPVL